jgi:hypothetical protein
MTTLAKLLKVLKQYETGYIGYPDLKEELVEITYIAQTVTHQPKPASTRTYRSSGLVCTAHAWGLRVTLPDILCEQCKSDI